MGVRPTIGLRVKLASRGSGRWKSSGGYRSKFGLSATEAMRALQELKDLGMADCLNLLHFHLGSQITNIRQIKGAVNEAVRVYVDLARAGAGLKYLDVGGGLGIDYDGSQTDFESSVNYTLQEYANDVIYHVQNVCDEVERAAPHHRHRERPRHRRLSQRAGVQRPGRVRHGRSRRARRAAGRRRAAADRPAGNLPRRSPPRTCWKATTTRSRRSTRRSTCSAWAISRSSSAASPRTCTGRSRRKIQKLARELDYFPEELEGIDAMLSDTYFCNFSLFQSMPDSWAIKQLFPIMPIHRLEEEPTRHAVLGDITCDSDGKVDAFIDRRDVKRTLPLHPFDGGDYYLGAFLLGAYQEILGDLHNLFGDTNAVHVRLGPTGEVILDSVIKGDTVREVLNYVQFNSDTLVHAAAPRRGGRAARRPPDATKRAARCCASTKKACTATRTWKTCTSSSLTVQPGAVCQRNHAGVPSKVMSPLENIVEDLKSLPPAKLEVAADFVQRLKRISQEERQAILARTAGALSPEEADELEQSSRRRREDR